MTVVENLNPKVQYVGPFEINDVLPITFPYIEKEYVYCKVNEDTLAFNAEYKVEGSNVILLVKVNNNSVVTIYRDTVLDQQAEFPQNNKFNSAKLNEALDKICMQQQEQQEKIGRSIKVPISNNKKVNSDLPPLEPNKALKVNKDGTGFEFTTYNPDDVEDASEEYARQAKESANNAEASNQSAIAQAQIATNKAQEATDIVTGFDTHAAEKQNAFDVNAATLTARYDNNDLAKTNAFNQNAQDMTDGFNTNAMLKMDDFDAHAMEKEMAFDDNAAAKQAQVDASANAAKLSEDNAKFSEANSAESERKAQIWAEGEDPDVENLGGVHSAKKWAETAGAIVGEGVIQDDTISLKTTYSSDKLEKHFAINEDHDSVLDCLDVLDSAINAKTVVPLSSLLAIDSDARPSHKAKGAEVYDEFGTMGIIDSVTETEATIITKESREKIKIVDTLDIQQNGFGQYYVALTANEIRNEIIKGKIVQLSFDDVITNTGEQIYEFETFTKDNYAVFRRNIITEDKAERINIKVDYQGIVQFDPVSYKALDYKNITNCITEIPQDIKVELNNGTLTLKAGSKVYRPNNTFSILPSDKSIITPNLTGDLVYYVNYNNTLDTISIGSIYSGDTFPGNNSLWLDTVKLNIKRTTSTGIQRDNCSFPIAICKAESGKITEIKQVFNGSGYIGSTVFALPNTKFLIPDGRNKDGSLKNINLVLDKVTVMPQFLQQNYTRFLLIKPNKTIISAGDINYFVGTTSERPITLRDTANYFYFDTEQNKTYHAQGSTTANWIEEPFALIGRYDSNQLNFKNVDFKQSFHALDYNDKNIITSWFAPSDRYVNLAKPQSNAPFIAPADGYFTVMRAMREATYMYVYDLDVNYTEPNENCLFGSWWRHTQGNNVLYTWACRKGQKFSVTYNGTYEDFKVLRFKYAQGEK